ncbi:beta-propeller domain-containing protein [Euzebya tangerina]|uniref:beta-propeller domain-containing protein n=1 Tax=Euzebya tangerina TaxID=591198 RepID=UPI000E30CBC2|nr:beta-propeller domain-containing protein [Euzebya tangerina]
MSPTLPTTSRALAAPSLLLVMALLLAVPSPADAQPAGFDGDPATTERIAAGDPVQAAVAVSQQRFPDGAPYAVLATSETFADSLAGAALTDEGPLLLTASQSLTASAATELDRVLDEGATIYVLGGVDAIAAGVTEGLESGGYRVTRLAGPTRIETAIAVADEVRARNPEGEAADTVLIARSDGTQDNPTSAWADSVAGGSLSAAAGIPILFTPTDGVTCESPETPCPAVYVPLHPAVEEWLDGDRSQVIAMLGGEEALTEGVEDALEARTDAIITRLAGPERTATAAAIADSDLWPRGEERRYVVLDGARDDGWAYGLSAAGIAADTGSPPLLVTSIITPETRRLVSTCGSPDVDLLLAGDTSVISADIEGQLTNFDGQACASDFAALAPFADCDETLAYFRNRALEEVTAYGLQNHYYQVEGLAIDEEAAADEEGPAPIAVPAAPADGGTTDGDSATPEVSDTNVQEVGVDEPDTVKVTAEAAYIVAEQAVQVMDLAAEVPARAATLDLPEDSYRHELLRDGDTLVVLSSGDGYRPVPIDDGPGPVIAAPDYYYPEPTTTLTRYDVTDRTDPTLIDTAELDGAYRSARMIDGVAHVVVSANPTGLPFVFPADGTPESQAASLDANREAITNSTIEDWLPSLTAGADTGALVPCDQVLAPPVFSGLTTVAVASIDVSESLVPTSSAAVVAQGETVYASMDRLVVTSTRWGRWNDEPSTPGEVTTEVHSFDITDSSSTTYVASGQVEGRVLNSYSISELNGYYRIATTRDRFIDGDDGNSDNGITVLTEGGGELFEVGRVFGLGLGERIFAVRYLGDIAAVVTFRQVDPLYLVDLSNPAAPRATGELKIPGVSRYLHPVSEDLLLGVGQDGTDDGLLIGLQVNLFDISDRAEPTRVDSIEYGAGESPVEFDARAFLYWPALDRAFVPADLYEGDVFSGGLAIDVDAPRRALEDAGRFDQGTDQFSSMERIFVVGDRVFGVSRQGVSAHDLESLDTLGFESFTE